MIGIRHIGTYVPPAFESNVDKIRQFNLSEDFLEEKLGVKSVARKLPTQQTSDLCIEAFKSLRSKIDTAPSDIDCLVVCTQNPDLNGIPQTSSLVHNKLGCPNECAAFDISLGCSGYVYSLSIVSAFMKANSLRNGLLFTADPYSDIINPHDKGTALLFGDAATVTYLTESEQQGIWCPEAFLFASKGSEGSALNNDSGQLAMDGRAIFNFAAREVPAQIKQLLVKTRLTYDDIDLFLFHQGSKYIIDILIKRLELPARKVPFDILPYGNTVSSSIPILFEKCLKDDHVNQVVMSGFGVGLSWASCYMKRI